MFVENQKKTPYISVIKLITGEEIIAKIVTDELTIIEMTNPLQMVMGQRGAQFAPWMMMATQGAKIGLQKDKILAQASASSELESQYESITTGIALPQKSSILTA